MFCVFVCLSSFQKCFENVVRFWKWFHFFLEMVLFLFGNDFIYF